MGKFFRSFVYAFQGIYTAVISDRNIRIEFTIAALVVAAGFWFGISRVEWLAVLLCIGMVLMAELFNTAIEKLTDLASPGYHDLAKKTKDIAAGAVLVASACAALVGLLIFVPYLIACFGN